MITANIQKNSKLLLFNYLRPNLLKILILILFLVLMYLGITQSWIFAEKDAGATKPWLYDTISFFPFWSIWIFTLIPLIPINLVFNTLGLHMITNSFYINPIIYLALLLYYYLLSCIAYYPLNIITNKIWKNFLKQNFN